MTTALQILYVLFLYFGLAEVIFQMWSPDAYANSFLGALLSFVIEEESILITLGATVVVTIWPITFMALTHLERRSKIRQVIRALT